MNLCIFFEGTGQGVEGRITNVTRMRDLCVDDSRQKLHLEAGPGTHFGSYLAGKIAGVDWRTTFRSARRWFEANYESLPKNGIRTSVFLFGFSRGALLARHFAAWLDKLGAAVAYLGLWDTVDSTVGLDVAADCPRNVKKARHAVSRGSGRGHRLSVNAWQYPRHSGWMSHGRDDFFSASTRVHFHAKFFHFPP